MIFPLSSNRPVYWKTKEISLRQAKTTKEVIVHIRQQLSKVEDGFSLIEIKLKDYDHLNTDVLERIQSGELLSDVFDNCLYLIQQVEWT